MTPEAKDKLRATMKRKREAKRERDLKREQEREGRKQDSTGQVPS